MKKLIFRFSLIFIFALFLINNAKSQSNQYLDFDGVDDWVNAPNASSLIANSNAFSMTGWFFDNNLNYGQGMMGFRTGTQGFYMIILNNGQIECRFRNASTLFDYKSPNGTVIPNIWQHYAWIYDGSSVKLYLNGNLVGGIAASGTITMTDIAFSIGKSPLSSFNFYYNGRIDEVSVWNKALTTTELQNMMQNELTGTEAGLKLYYKFNQGVPAGNNASITKLQTEVNSPTYDGDLAGFAMNGATSNFNGTLNTTFQAISFPQIPTKLVSDPPFTLNATATSGLPVSYTLVSGPASINGNTVTLNGAGTVTIRASQLGNAQYDSASPVINVFDVVDPAQNLPIIEERHPLAGNVYMSSLSKIQLAAKASINYPNIFNVQSVKFKINGQTINATDFSNGHYTAWWQPSSFGNHSIEIIATSNMGATASKFVNINILQNAIDTSVVAFNNVLISSSTPNSVIVEGNLPSFIGAYDTILATLQVSCPTGGCGAWDYVASVDAMSHEGNWFEIIRYITPYGTPCTHKLNVTDYASIVNGKVTFRVNCGSLDNGYLYKLTFDYKAGTPPHIYSQVSQIWKKTYQFGDMANLQPVEVVNYTFPTGSLESKLKLISTGHGWGNLNTGNAAEFYNATHKIQVNNANTFTQANWTNCNPNPDNCMPQNGTWQYNRAGWCPGSIARPFDFNMTPFIANNNISLKYIFYEQYVDQCHPNNPSCVTGTTCTDCNDGFNPHLVVACNLVNFFDTPPPTPLMQEVEENDNFGVLIYPNPSNGKFSINSKNGPDLNYTVSVYNLIGKVIKEFTWNGELHSLDLSNEPKGIYLVRISCKGKSFTKKLIIR